MACTPAWAQMSILLVSTSVRIGIEPFLLLKATWPSGEIIISASFFWAAAASGAFCFGNTNTSPPIA